MFSVLVLTDYTYLNLAYIYVFTTGNFEWFVRRDLRHVPLVSFFIYSVTLDHASGINNNRKEMF